MNDEGLKLRKLKRFNRESRERILANRNIRKTYEDGPLVRDLEAVFGEIDWMRERERCQPS